MFGNWRKAAPARESAEGGASPVALGREADRLAAEAETLRARLGELSYQNGTPMGWAFTFGPIELRSTTRRIAEGIAQDLANTERALRAADKALLEAQTRTAGGELPQRAVPRNALADINRPAPEARSPLVENLAQPVLAARLEINPSPAAARLPPGMVETITRFALNRRADAAAQGPGNRARI
ncbi:MAG: hypothetical protein HXY25_07345 [Alphaproteobacteria bacterium]|nr:hypothetical protein [Alphaproteobacteria bacterium]